MEVFCHFFVSTWWLGDCPGRLTPRISEWARGQLLLGEEVDVDVCVTYPEFVEVMGSIFCCGDGLLGG